MLAQLPSYHQLALLDKLPGPDERRWCAAKASQSSWLRNVLVLQIATRLLERSGQGITIFPPRCPRHSLDAHNDVGHGGAEKTVSADALSNQEHRAVNSSRLGRPRRRGRRRPWQPGPARDRRKRRRRDCSLASMDASTLSGAARNDSGRMK
jgi:hypothetical protein